MKSAWKRSAENYTIGVRMTYELTVSDAECGRGAQCSSSRSAGTEVKQVAINAWWAQPMG